MTTEFRIQITPADLKRHFDGLIRFGVLQGLGLGFAVGFPAGAIAVILSL